MHLTCVTEQNWNMFTHFLHILVYNGCQKLMAGIHGPTDSLQAMLQLLKMQ